MMIDKQAPSLNLDVTHIESPNFRQTYKALFDEYVRLRSSGHRAESAFRGTFGARFAINSIADLTYAQWAVDRIAFFRIEEARRKEIEGKSLEELLSIDNMSKILNSIAESPSATARTKVDAVRLLNGMRRDLNKIKGCHV
ncbi:hypothetical protein [Cupriavidus nantongensis]|uniref:Uncharacterized protein n=1 Tax=Cupriavidus nantongensis TaxID=1796606 RepID=A0A142JNH9_9BURK|nr:hypothetical protein [Cupriavidus nantongensis]AMR79641.1 hypothetical protein A2G96_18855 [Cupriavidus nantongensis]